MKLSPSSEPSSRLQMRSSSTYANEGTHVSTLGASDLYSHADARGFINLFALPLKVAALSKAESE